MRTCAREQANSAGTRRFPQQRQIKEKNATIRETKKYFFLIFFEKQFLSFYFEKSFETVFRKVILIEKQKRLQIVFEQICPQLYLFFKYLETFEQWFLTDRFLSNVIDSTSLIMFYFISNNC